MKTTTTPFAMQRLSAKWQAEGHSIGFVPTMGFLHEGHQKLLEEARKQSDRLVLSIFVNPLQFGPNEDFATYPRDDARDRAMAKNCGVDAIFYPTPEAMYPAGTVMRVNPGPTADLWEGAFRPGFFTGVCTVVLKLFQIIRPQATWFGLKDFQQFSLVGRMIKDFNLPIKLVGVPTVREKDGLAKSSRNVYLSPEDRQRALCLYQAMKDAQAAVDKGEKSSKKIESLMAKRIQKEVGTTLDYAVLVDPETLQPAPTIDRPLRALLAAKVGRTRLIDNAPIKSPRRIA